MPHLRALRGSVRFRGRWLDGRPAETTSRSAARRTQEIRGGTTTYLSTANKDDLFIAQRNGTATKDGCIFVINDNMTQSLTNTVNTGWAQGTVLVDALQTNHSVTVQSGGLAPLSASNRFYRVYVRQSAL